MTWFPLVINPLHKLSNCIFFCWRCCCSSLMVIPEKYFERLSASLLLLLLLLLLVVKLVDSSFMLLLTILFRFVSSSSSALLSWTSQSRVLFNKVKAADANVAGRGNASISDWMVIIICGDRYIFLDGWIWLLIVVVVVLFWRWWLFVVSSSSVTTIAPPWYRGVEMTGIIMVE